MPVLRGFGVLGFWGFVVGSVAPVGKKWPAFVSFEQRVVFLVS